LPEEGAPLFSSPAISGGYSSRSARALRGALAVSIALHALLLVGYLTRDIDPPAAVVETLRSLEVVLTPPVEDLSQDEPELIQEPIAEVIQEDSAEAIAEVPAEALVDAPVVDEPVETVTLDAPPVAPQRQSLNLQRPSDWESLVLDSPGATEGLVFKGSTRAAITKRREQQDAQRALSNSQVARLGLPAETYRRQTDDGEEVKTSKGCFVKRQEQGPSGGQIRWWRTRCVDAKKPAWKREVLSFGPDHKVDTEAAERKSDCPNGRCWAY